MKTFIAAAPGGLLRCAERVLGPIGLLLAAAWLCGCGGGGGGGSPPPEQPGVTLSLSSTSGTLKAGEAVDTTATIVRSGGFTGEVTIGGSGGGSGITVTGGVIAAGATSTNVRVATSTEAAFGLSSLSVTASATGLTIAPASYALTVQDPARSGPIPAAFPRVNGIVQLPDYPSTRQLAWVLAQLATGSTSVQEIDAHFTPQALAATPAAQWQALLQEMRTSSPNAIVVDLVAATPVRVTAVIGTPGTPASGRYLQLTTRYAGAGLIDALTAAPFALNASVQFAADRTLTLAQAADKFLTLAPQASLLVARINNRQCTAIEERGATVPRATGSLFKHWVLGAVAQAVHEGALSPSAVLPLAGAETVRNSLLAAEPVGTPIPLADMATLMMGNSDNTATDHLHQLVGRARAEAQLALFNHGNAALMTPFLSVNEQFNLLLGGVSLADALAYASGTEAYQRNYVDTVLEPLGPVAGTQQNLPAFLTSSWQSSAQDVCAAFAGMRRFTDGSDALRLIDRALGSSVAQPFVRDEWERVWYKGGSLVGSTGNLVLAHSWMLETGSRGTFVVIALANNPAGGIDEFQVQSVTSRILQLVKGL